jgi:hypothetical protein
MNVTRACYEPLGAGLGPIVLSKRGSDEGGDHAPPALAGVRRRIAHEVHAAALPASVDHLGDGGLEVFVRVGETSLTPRRPRQANLRRNAVQNVGPPSLLTPTATITATDTFWRTCT